MRLFGGAYRSSAEFFPAHANPLKQRGREYAGAHSKGPKHEQKNYGVSVHGRLVQEAAPTCMQRAKVATTPRQS